MTDFAIEICQECPSLIQHTFNIGDYTQTGVHSEVMYPEESHKFQVASARGGLNTLKDRINERLCL